MNGDTNICHTTTIDGQLTLDEILIFGWTIASMKSGLLQEIKDLLYLSLFYCTGKISYLFELNYFLLSSIDVITNCK